MQGRRRFGRRGEQGQVIPIVAMLILIITGFAAISLDAGIDYAQSRNDNDISDAAALAGTYWAIDYPSATAGLTLSGLYTAELHAATADGCNTGQCHAPMVTIGSSTYSVAELWTTTAFTAGSSPTIYVGSTGTCSTSASGTFALATCPAMSSILDVGAPVSDKTTDLFAAVVGGHPVGITPNAVAAVTGTGTGATSTNPTKACEICIFGNAQMNGSGDELLAGGGSIDIGGYLWYDTNDATVETTNGYGIDVNGQQQESGASVLVGGSSDLVDASGSLTIDGPLTFNSSNSTVEGASTNISGTVGATYWQTSGNVITPSAYGTTAVNDFTDPMASVAVPTYTTATTNCSAVGTVQSGTANVTSCLTVSGSTATLASGVYANVTLDLSTTVSPGEYESLTVGAPGLTITFGAGTYIFDGTGIDVNATSTTLSGTELTFYMTCGSGTTPASCGAWTASTFTCGSTKSGSSVNLGGSTALNLQGPTGTNPVLFFFDRCNSNTEAFWVDSPGVTAGGGYPAGMLYAYSGEVQINASTNALPSPLLVGNVYYDAGSITLGTSTGAVALAGSSSSGPGNLVN
ncbi:MAG: hypothetical protein ABSB36_01105 [Candidatus Dormibacteria bacterium]|jgi:hypothetical protein